MLDYKQREIIIQISESISIFPVVVVQRNVGETPYWCDS